MWIIILISLWLLLASVATWQELIRQNSFFFWAKIHKANNNWFDTVCFCVPALLRIWLRNLICWPWTLKVNYWGH